MVEESFGWYRNKNFTGKYSFSYSCRNVLFRMAGIFRKAD